MQKGSTGAQAAYNGKTAAAKEPPRPTTRLTETDMAGAVTTPEPPVNAPEAARAGRYVEYEQFIEAQINRTRRQVKLVEVAVAVVQLIVCVLLYVLLVVLIDHWVAPGGLSPTARLVAFLGLALGSVGLFAWRVAPIIGRRVNVVYAAHSIEQTQPSLKNSLVNFLLLRREKEHLAGAIYQAIEQRAARDLNDAPVEDAVDRSHLVRVFYVLAALVIVLCLYKLFSPKDPLRTFGRLAAPWADITPPTRVTIIDVQPGSTRVFRGRVVKVSAQVVGLRHGEPVQLVLTTADGQMVRQSRPMALPADGYRHELDLPGDVGGLQQSVEYQLTAGDFTSPTFKIEVVTAPSILVERVRYDYPAYADVAPRVVEKQGDLHGIEGTAVTIDAAANVPMKAAYIDFNSDGGRDLPLVLEGSKATGSFKLQLSDGGRPLHENYQIRFTDEHGNENPQPIRHAIDVVADQPPAIEITEPAKDLVEMAVNGSLPIRLRAGDRDFRLRRVILHFSKDGKPLTSELLLDAARAGTFEAGHVFEPAKFAGFQLNPGDVIEYWAEARDNRTPTANHAETVKYKIRLAERVNQKEEERQRREAERKTQEADRQARDEAQSKGEQPNDDSKPTSPADAQETEAPQEDPTNEQKPVDPEQDAAEALERIVDYREQKESQANDSAQPQEKEPSAPDEQDPQPQDDAGDKPEQQSPQDEQKPKDTPKEKPEPKKQKPDESEGDGQDGGAGGQNGGKDKKKPPQEDDQQSGGDGESGSSQSDESQESGSGNSAKQKQGAGQGGRPQSAEQQPASDSSSGEGPAGDGQSGGKEKSQPGSQSTAQDGASSSGESKKSSGAGQSQSKPQAEGQQAGAGDNSHQPGETKSQQSTGEEQTDRADEGKKPQAGEGRSPSGEQAGDAPNEGEGDRAGDPAGMKEPQAKPDGKAPAQESQAGGGDPQQQKGNQGAGQGSQQQKPSPNAQGANQPKSKQPGQPGQPPEQNEAEQADSPSNSDKESNSRGGEAGDRSGGGKKGGGQKANSAGTGAAGQNTESDEGAGQAQSAGGGETSGKAGNSAAGQKPTSGSGSQSAGAGAAGESGQGGGMTGGQPGDGDAQPSQRAPLGGERPGGAAAGSAAAKKPGAATNRDDSEPQPGEKDPTEIDAEEDRAQGPSKAGGAPEHEPVDGQQQEEIITEADPVNLEYAKKATNMVLESLEKQVDRGEIDPELLKKLGWTPDDMKRFVDHWNKLCDAAAHDPQARQQLDEAIARLGLKRRRVSIEQQSIGGDDKMLREMRWTNPPAEYAEQFKAYTEGAARRPGQ